NPLKSFLLFIIFWLPMVKYHLPQLRLLLEFTLDKVGHLSHSVHGTPPMTFRQSRSSRRIFETMSCYQTHERRALPDPTAPPRCYHTGKRYGACRLALDTL